MAGMAGAGAATAPAPLFVDGRPLARYLADVRCGTLLLEGKVTEEHVIAVAGLLACDTKFTQLFLTRTGCTDRGACELRERARPRSSHPHTWEWLLCRLSWRRAALGPGLLSLHFWRCASQCAGPAVAD